MAITEAIYHINGRAALASERGEQRTNVMDCDKNPGIRGNSTNLNLTHF